MNRLTNRQQKPLIVMCTNHFYPDLSSGGRLLADLAIGLTNDFRVSVITTYSDYNSKKSTLTQEVYNDVHIERLQATSFSRQKILGRLINELTFCFAVSWRLLFSPKPSLIYALSSPPLLPFFIAMISSLRKVPYVFVLMDIFPDAAVAIGLIRQDSLIARFWSWFTCVSLIKSKHVVVLGRCMRDVVSDKVYPKKVEISIIHNWCDKNKTFPIAREKNPFFSEYPHLKDKFIVMYSGNLGRFQDFESILSCANSLLDQEGIHIIIAGNGVRREWLAKEITKQKLGNVSLLPFVPSEELNALLNAADLGLVTLERGMEGLGVPSKFYPLIAAGKPILALMGKKSEVALLIEEEQIGIVVEQGDITGLVSAVSQFFSDKTFYTFTSEKALNLFLQKFDRQNAINEYTLLLKRLCILP